MQSVPCEELDLPSDPAAAREQADALAFRYMKQQLDAQARAKAPKASSSSSPGEQRREEQEEGDEDEDGFDDDPVFGPVCGRAFSAYEQVWDRFVYYTNAAGEKVPARIPDAWATAGPQSLLRCSPFCSPDVQTQKLTKGALRYMHKATAFALFAQQWKAHPNRFPERDAPDPNAPPGTPTNVLYPLAFRNPTANGMFIPDRGVSEEVRLDMQRVLMTFLVECGTYWADPEQTIRLFDASKMNPDTNHGLIGNPFPSGTEWEPDQGDAGVSYDAAGTLTLLQSPEAAKNLQGLGAIIDVMKTDPDQVQALLAIQTEKHVVALLAPVVTGEEERAAKATVRQSVTATRVDAAELARARKVLDRVTVAMRAAEALEKMLDTDDKAVTSPALRPVLFDTNAHALLVEMMREGMGKERGDVATKALVQMVDPHVEESVAKVAEGDVLPLLMTMLRQSRTQNTEDAEMAARAIELLDALVAASSSSPVRAWLANFPQTMQLLAPWVKHVPGQKHMLEHLVSMLARIPITHETTQRMIVAGMRPALVDLLTAYDITVSYSDEDFDMGGYILEDVGTILLEMAETDPGTVMISFLQTPRVADQIVRTLEFYPTSAMSELLDLIVADSQPVRRHLMANPEPFLSVMGRVLNTDHDDESRNAANIVAAIAGSDLYHSRAVNAHEPFMEQVMTLLHSQEARTTRDLVAYAKLVRVLIATGHEEATAFFNLRPPDETAVMLNTYLNRSRPMEVRLIMADIVRLFCEASSSFQQEFARQRTALELVSLFRDVEDEVDDGEFAGEPDPDGKVTMALLELAENSPDNAQLIKQCGMEHPYDTYEPSKDTLLPPLLGTQ